MVWRGVVVKTQCDSLQESEMHHSRHVSLQASKMDKEWHGLKMEIKCMDNIGEVIGTCIEYANEMGLADEQIVKMKPICREMRKKQARFKADLKIAEIEFAEIMEVKNFDIEKASHAVNKNASIIKSLHYEMLKSTQEMRAILTDRQFKEMNRFFPRKTGGQQQ